MGGVSSQSECAGSPADEPRRGAFEEGAESRRVVVGTARRVLRECLAPDRHLDGIAVDDTVDEVQRGSEGKSWAFGQGRGDLASCACNVSVDATGDEPPVGELLTTQGSSRQDHVLRDGLAEAFGHDRMEAAVRNGAELGKRRGYPRVGGHDRQVGEHLFVAVGSSKCDLFLFSSLKRFAAFDTHVSRSRGRFTPA